MIFSIFDYNLSIGELIILLFGITAVFMISLSFHEWAHGFVAYKQGDPSAKMTGRLTLNPLAHIDATGFVMFLLIGVGWAKPMPVNPNNFKKYRSGIAKVSIAGVVANLILCIIGSFLYIFTLNMLGDGNDLLVIIMYWLMLVNAYLLVFNLIPIPPLDGSKVLMAVLPERYYFSYMSFEQFGMFFLLLLITFGAFDGFLVGARSSVISGMLQIANKIIVLA